MAKETYEEFSNDSSKTWTCKREDCKALPNLKSIERLIEVMNSKLEATINEIRKGNEEVKKAAHFMNENFEKLKKELQGIKKNVEIMKKEEKINTMLDSLENIQQYQRKNNIIISGIPVSEQEDVYDDIFQLGHT
jgi:uncharacterized protein (UPF0305 family)